MLEEDPLDGVEYLPLFGIISDHFIVAIPEEDISLGDFRKKNYINGDVLVDISTFLRRGGGHIIDVILRSKVRNISSLEFIIVVYSLNYKCVHV